MDQDLSISPDTHIIVGQTAFRLLLVTLVGYDPTNSALRGQQLYQFVHRARWYSQGATIPCLRLEGPAT